MEPETIALWALSAIVVVLGIGALALGSPNAGFDWDSLARKRYRFSKALEEYEKACGIRAEGLLSSRDPTRALEAYPTIMEVKRAARELVRECYTGVALGELSPREAEHLCREALSILGESAGPSVGQVSRASMLESLRSAFMKPEKK